MGKFKNFIKNAVDTRWLILPATVLVIIGFQNFSSLSPQVRLKGHVPEKALANAHHLGRARAEDRMNLTVYLRLRNENVLDEMISGQNDPLSPHYKRFLSPQEFTAQFGPTPEDVMSATNYFQSLGFNIVGGTFRTVQLSGTVDTVEKAFSLQVHTYQTADNRIVHASDNDPLVDGHIAQVVLGVHGLNDMAQAHRPPRRMAPSLSSDGLSGPSGSGMGPVDIRKAYGLNGLGTGSGQSVALFEPATYNTTDISAYTTQFGISPPATLQNIVVDGGPKNVTTGDIQEVETDIELIEAVAPGAKILVYEGPNTAQGSIDILARMANDNVANQISISWGYYEAEMDANQFNTENTVFKQMAVQGQTVFAASGDNGAYAASWDKTFPNSAATLMVQDPSSNPYVVGVGGTNLRLTSTGDYSSETSWADRTSSPAGGGGGGISSFWTIPTWQSGLATSANKGSTSMRMVPDVALDADDNNMPYSLFETGAWYSVGGTSCGAPLWAAYIALVNAKRVSTGLGSIGFLDPIIYQMGRGSQYSQLFHDVNDGSTNLYYPAVTGYDLSTGWGSMQGASLFNALSTYTSSGPTPTPTPAPTATQPPPAPTQFKAVQL